MDPLGRLTCEELIEHPYFDGFSEWFQPELEVYIYYILYICVNIK